MKTRLVYAVMLVVICGCAANQPKKQQAPDAGTLASPALQKETLNMILFTDDAMSQGVKCNDRRIVKKEVLEQAPDSAPASWTERWTLNRCGTIVRYRVIYTSGKKGAYFTVRMEK